MAVDVSWLLCAARRWSFAAVSWAVGALTREKPTSVGWIPVFAKSLGVTEALGGSPWVAFMAWDEDTLGFLSSNNC